ncbi:gamma-glutamylcyclotransferase [Adhaeribacter arboris]|uniref:Gamma-glutamylcyclotransferase n=1 Tax=Adhaeribacter arboris TaxID=2072846 RepID=A0A2T2YPK9_9BACT|nr:gamma-glutamylcyclotransferase [Adhaeribacter arboris]
MTEEEKELLQTYKPEKSLIIYGSLAPNKPNHAVVEHIKGEWKKGIVRGKLENVGWGAALGYLGFKHCRKKDQQKISMFALISDELVSNWQMLDEFEGDEYRRILAKYELDTGEIGVGYIYAINEEKA